MTIDQLAERLGIKYSLARDLMRSYKPPTNFPSICIGRRWIVDEAAFEEWYATHIGVIVPASSRKRHEQLKPQKRKFLGKPDFSDIVFEYRGKDA